MKNYRMLPSVATHALVVITLVVLNLVSGFSQSDYSISVQSTSFEMPYFDGDEFRFSQGFQGQIINSKLLSNKKITLKLRIEGQGITIMSRNDFYPSPINVDAQPIYLLNNYNLSEYFDLENLSFSGYSKEQYVKNQGLPTGFYRVCFQVVDVSTDEIRPASTEFCLTLQSKYEDFPRITFPRNNATISNKKPTIFAWQSLSTSLRSNTFLFEIYSFKKGQNYREVIQLGDPVLREELNSTVYTFIPSREALDVNGNYFCIVQALPNSRSQRYKNSGFSDPVYFNISESANTARLAANCENEGDPCDDNNECTEGDAYDENCNCVGSPIMDISIIETSETITETLCSFCVPLTPPGIGTGIPSCIYNYEILVFTPSGSLVLGSNTVGMDFPYCFNLDACEGGASIPCNSVDFYGDFQNWIYDNGFTGTVSDHGCTGGIYFENTNIEIISMNYVDGQGNNITIEPTNIDCNDFTETIYTYEVVTECNDITSYEWNTGQTTPIIEMDQAGDCPQVTITCGDVNPGPCYFSATFGDNCDNCIVDDPCDDGLDCTSNDVYDDNCNCVGVPINDSDGDGVCDELDICPGFDDLLDGDHDGIPDGCDEAPECDVYGQTCNDYNDCTINDTYNSNCVCVGEQIIDVTILDSVVYDSLCSFCVTVAPENYGYDNSTLVFLHSLNFIDGQGEMISLDQTLNYTGFDFPYCLGLILECNNFSSLYGDFPAHLNNWIQNYNFSGFVYAGKTCDGGLQISSTNLNLESAVALTEFGDTIIITPSNIECTVFENGYNLYVETQCDSIISYLWNAGQTTSSITIDSLGGCYSVDILCGTDSTNYCKLVGVYGENCEECFIGAPCDDQDSCTFHDVVTIDCLCQGQEGLDSDEDGVCDEIDICPGYDDFIDIDSDGIPDGCDTLIDCDSLKILIEVDTLLPSNCDYSINLDSLLGDNEFINLTNITAGDQNITNEYNLPICYGNSTVTNIIVSDDSFENDWGFWGGYPPDASRIEDPEFANSGSYSLRLRDDSSESYIKSEMFFVSGYDRIRVDFTFISEDLISVEDYFTLEVSFDQGITYSIVESWSYLNDFSSNGVFYTKSSNIVNQGNTALLRFKSNTNNNSKRVYFDDIKISKLSGGCSNQSSIELLAQGINAWLNDNNYGGQASYVYFNNEDTCQSTGHSLLISDSTIEFYNITGETENSILNFDFCHESCQGNHTGDTLLQFKIIPNCESPEYQWSNGETIDHIVLPISEETGHNVTITCGEQCDTILTIYSNNCEVGTPCDPNPQYPCFMEWVYDEECNCIGSGLNTVDSDDDGIWDCNDPCPQCALNDSDNDGICDCDEDCLPVDSLVFTYEPILENKCNFCISVDGFAASVSLDSAIVTLADMSLIKLHELSNFDFGYCAQFSGYTCDNGLYTMKEFKSHMYSWLVSLGYQPKIRFEYNCHKFGYFSIFIGGVDFEKIQLFFGSTERSGFNVVQCFEDTIGYTVTVSPPDLCGSPDYYWSNGSTENNIEVIDSTIGYFVEIVCANGCTYEDSLIGNCFLGATCNDADPCTINDRFDENCNCVGQPVVDSDNDGVCDSLDICEGYNDYVDANSNGIPDGCEVCDSSQINVCDFCADLNSPNLILNWDEYYINGFEYIENGSLDEINIGDSFCVPLQNGSCPISQIDEFVTYLNSWISLNGYNGTASVVNTLGTPNRCSSGGLSLMIMNSDIDYHILDISNIPNSISNIRFNKVNCRTISNDESPCDDGDECTINDALNENCLCEGIPVPDSDFDGVCDSLDLCQGFPDYMDSNANGVPDGCENVYFKCNTDSLLFCEYFDEIVTCSDKFRPIPILPLQDTLQLWLSQNSETAVIGFNIPELRIQLNNRSANDSDRDGIINILDICPSVSNSPSLPHGFYTLADFDGCCDNTIDSAKASLLANLFFQAGNASIYYNGNLIYSPGCLPYPGLTELDGWIVNSDSTECRYAFEVDCNCDCKAVLLTDADQDELCDAYDTVQGVECMLECPDTSICVTCRVVGNPLYDAFTNPDVPPCMLEYTDLPDTDGDGICDIIDECMPPEGESYEPGETPQIYDDNVDSDGDGIVDCNDPCVGGWMGVPNPDFIPIAPGDPCDDGDPCTFADSISVNCNCEGIILDLDDDGVTDCQECDIMFTDTIPGSPTVIVDNFGPFIECDSCYSISCDVCPGLPDTLDYNENGVPDCLDPPYYDIGCPTSYILVEGLGVVLVFDSEEILIEDIPEPITVTYMGDGVENEIGKLDYLTKTNTREVDGTFEVLYGLPDLFLISNNLSYLSISFADHQNCVFAENDTLIDVICPSDFFISSLGELHMVFDYNGLPGTPDLGKLEGNFDINFYDESNALSGTYQGGNINSSQNNIFELSLGSIGSTDDFSPFLGSITLPNGTVCAFDSTTGILPPCPNDPTLTPSYPCDDMDECTHHDRIQIINGVCECLGDPSPDVDGDGICDAIDPCPDEINDGPDNDGDGYPDCPCPSIVINSDSITAGGDILLDIDTSSVGGITEFTFEISGGPDGMINDTAGIEMPVSISNLPKGYEYDIKIIANGETGCTSDTTLTIDVPFETYPALCGIEIDLFDLTSITLLPSLSKGDVITAADFDVTIRSVNGSNGKFTGKGYISIPVFGNPRINVSFKDIIISSDKQLVQGYININGYGIAILGDPLSDDINDILTDIISVLDDINDILDELIPLLETIDELVSTTEQFVSDEAKECIETKKMELEALKAQAEANPNDPDIVQQIKDKSIELQDCVDAYEDELALILDNLFVITKDVFNTYVQNTCDGSQTTAYNNATLPISDFNSRKAALENSFPGGGSGFSGFTEGWIISDSISLEPSEAFSPSLEIIANNFYQVESDYQVCILLDKLMGISSGTSQYTDPKDALIIANLYLLASSEVVDEISQRVSDGESNDSIKTDPIIIDELINSLKTALFYKLYKRL